MDPLSIAASVAGLITVSTQILSIISTVKSKNNKELDSLSREVTAIRGILCEIQQIIQFQSAKPTKSSEWLDTINATLDDCGDLYLGLQKELQGLFYHSKFDALKKKVKWTLKENDIQETLRKLESYKLSLDLLLSVQTSATTSNIEEILVEVQKKLSLKPAESPIVRTPLSWRKKLAGFVSEPTKSQPQDNTIASIDSQSTLIPADSKDDTPYIIPGPKTAGWNEPGAHGINRDEGTDAPDLNSPDLTCLCEMQIGRQKISLICGWEDAHSTNVSLRPIRAHILFKGPSQGDLNFLQLAESMTRKPTERFVTPAGKSGLIIARCDTKGSTCLLKDLSTRDDREEFQLSVEDYALKSSPDAQQILVNFENVHDRGQFLAHLYGLRYLQHMDFVFAMTNQFYRHSPYTKRIQHIQLGYADGTEKSYIYPYLDVEYSLGDEGPQLAFRAKPNGPTILFRESLLSMNLEIVSPETMLCTTEEGTIVSATFGSLDELVQKYYRLQDTIQEWKLLSTKGIDEYKTEKEWNLTSLEFQEGSKPPLEPFGMVRIIAKSDKCSKRLKLDILDQQTFEKQASCYVMLSSVIHYKQRFRKSDPDFFTFPNFLGGFWDLREGGTESAAGFKSGQVRMHCEDEKKLCEGLEDLVETILEKSRDEQKRFLSEVSRV